MFLDFCVLCLPFVKFVYWFGVLGFIVCVLIACVWYLWVGGSVVWWFCYVWLFVVVFILVVFGFCFLVLGFDLFRCGLCLVVGGLMFTCGCLFDFCGWLYIVVFVACNIVVGTLVFLVFGCFDCVVGFGSPRVLGFDVFRFCLLVLSCF